MQVLIDLYGLIAIAALALSGYATWKTAKFNKRQESLVGSQEALNDLLMEREQNELHNRKRANLGASFLALGASKYRLRIWNQGPVAARNLRLEILKGHRTLSSVSTLGFLVTVTAPVEHGTATICLAFQSSTH